MISRWSLAAFAVAALASSSAVAQQSGATSGPVAGSHTTLGTGGRTPTTPHQSDALHNKGGGSIQGEHQGQAGGSDQTIAPVLPAPNPAGTRARGNPRPADKRPTGEGRGLPLTGATQARGRGEYLHPLACHPRCRLTLPLRS